MDEYQQPIEIEEAETEMEEERRVPITGNKWFVGLVGAAIAAWMGWASLMLISVDRRVAIIEGNRFDSNMALQHANEDRALNNLVNSHISMPGHPVLIERVLALSIQLDKIERNQEKILDWLK